MCRVMSARADTQVCKWESGVGGSIIVSVMCCGSHIYSKFGRVNSNEDFPIVSLVAYVQQERVC